MAKALFYPSARALLQVVIEGIAGGEGSESMPLIIPTIPKSLTVHRNSYRQADSFSVVFDAGDLPVDPQSIRAGTVELFLFNMPGVASVNQRSLSRQFAGINDAGETLPKNRFTFENKPLIIGLFDDTEVEMDSSGKWVTITGQDYTSFLIAKQWKPTDKGLARRIPVGQRLDVWVGDILREADPHGRLQVAAENIDSSTLPFVGTGETKAHGRGIPIEAGTSYWDVIYKTVIRYGFVVFVRGLDVVISRPRNITNLKTTDIKKLAWGKNLETVRLTRHLGTEKVPRIVVQSYDLRARKMITVEFPDTGLRRAQKEFKVNKSKRSSLTDKLGQKPKSQTQRHAPPVNLTDEFQIIPIFWTSDRAALKRIAENYYEKIGRAERKIVAITKDLEDSKGHSLMDLSTGDAVEIEWVDIVREDFMNRTSQAEKYQYLISRGFGAPVAQIISRFYFSLLGTRRAFHVREVTYNYDEQGGVQIEIEVIDFVKVDGGIRDKEADNAAENAGEHGVTTF